jgi:Polyketide cyclase / dehydrase and lipid transport
MQWLRGDAVVPGAQFRGTNRHGTKTWSTTCTITHADPGQVFAFDVRSAVVPVAHWRYDIVAADGGCRVSPSASGTAGPVGSVFLRAGRRA